MLGAMINAFAISMLILGAEPEFSPPPPPPPEAERVLRPRRRADREPAVDAEQSGEDFRALQTFKKIFGAPQRHSRW